MFALISNLRTAAGRPLSHAFACLATFVVLGVGFAGQASAAGCSHEGQSAVGGLDPYGKPLADNVIKVYSGGEFQYYALPTGKSCNGPNCKSAPPTRMDSTPAVTSSERADLSFLVCRSYSSYSLYCDRFVAWPNVWPTSLVLDGLLRPPTV